MGPRRFVWGFSDIGGMGWAFPGGWRAGFRRRRHQMFESGEFKYVILELLREKPRHGYELIKALEEKMRGCYTPSAGVVYPTLQLLEDQGYVRAKDAEGKKTYHITKEGEAFLDEHRDTVDDIFDRVEDAVHGFVGGRMGDLHQAFAHLASVTYRKAWRLGADDPEVKRLAEILRRAAAEVEEGRAAR